MGMMEEWRGVSGERVGEDERSERGGGEGRGGRRRGNISLSALIVCDTSGVTVQMNGYDGRVERGEWRESGEDGRSERGEERGEREGEGAILVFQLRMDIRWLFVTPVE